MEAAALIVGTQYLISRLHVEFEMEILIAEDPAPAKIPADLKVEIVA